MDFKFLSHTLMFVLFVSLNTALAQAKNKLWIELDKEKLADVYPEELPLQYKVFQVKDIEKLESVFNTAPIRFSAESRLEKVKINLPLPNGNYANFMLLNSPVLQPELAAAYPRLKTFTGIGVENPNLQAKIEYTPHGIYAMIIGGDKGTMFIQPLEAKTHTCYSFYSRDATNLQKPFNCQVEDEFPVEEIVKPNYQRNNTDCQFRQYRLALACTGEFAQLIDDGDDTNGDITADVLADMVVVTNRVNGIFEKEIGLTMVIIDRNEEIIFTDPETDLYNDEISTLPAQNTTIMQITIGNDAFDIGHVFSSQGGGIAFTKGPCVGRKAGGASGRRGRMAESFGARVVAHEMGHQFGGRHTQGNDCNRNARSSYEPGSGSTVLSYAGICPPLVEPDADDYFHAINIQQMREFITQDGGGDCAVILDANNVPPIVDAGQDYIIPASTPFILEGQASDPDGDSISYCWEQWDKEFAVQPPSPLSTEGPTFRSFPPTTDPRRYVPSLNFLNGDVDDDRWEILPEVSRDLTFLLTARGNNGIFGCVSEDSMSISTIDSAGPFEVTSQNVPTTWRVGDPESISWNVAGTDLAPINCAEVDIYYSTDGGLSYPFLFAENVANSGIYSFNVPDLGELPLRFLVRCSDNIFFNVTQAEVMISDQEATCEQTVFSSDSILNISEEGTPSISSTINIEADLEIKTVNVINIKGAHSFLSDLEFVLISPAGTEILLLTLKCFGGNFRFSFSDDGMPYSCPLNDGQIALPEFPLSGFEGERSQGIWTLLIEDKFPQDGGFLEGWGIEICDNNPTTTSTNTEQASIGDLVLSPNPAREELMVSLSFKKPFEGQVQIINLVGQVFYQSPFNANQLYREEIDLNKLPSGVYFLRVLGVEGEGLVRKFLKH